MNLRVSSALILAALWLPQPAFGGQDKKPSPEQAEFFEKKIRPVLANNCYKCHSGKAKKIKAELGQ